jgi:hypothetical protein
MKINELTDKFNNMTMSSISNNINKNKIKKNKRYIKNKKNNISKLHKIGIHLFKGKDILNTKKNSLTNLLIEIIKQYNKFYNFLESDLDNKDNHFEFNLSLTIKNKLNNNFIENITIKL